MKTVILAALLILASTLSVGPRFAQAAAPPNIISPDVCGPCTCGAVCGPPCPVDFPCNVWAPYGPMVQKLRLQYYSSPDQEYQNFLNGKIDVMDTNAPRCRVVACFGTPDTLASPPQGGFSLYGIYFNGAASTWRAWGCDWNTGTPFTSSEQTYVTQCGINMRQAFAHLIDKPSFVAAYGGQTDTGLLSLVDPSPLSKDPSGSNASTQCSWDLMFPICNGAYRITPSPGGFAQPGSPDFCAAGDHMIAAGIAAGKQATSCVLTGVNPGVFAHRLRLFVNTFGTTHPARLILGNGFTNTLNQLFGGQAVSQSYCRGFTCYQLIFQGPNDTFDAYTYGYVLVGPYPDHLTSFYYSQQASNYCGGPLNQYPNNPTEVCIPILDQHIKAANTTDLSVFRTETLAAFNEFGKHAVDIPIYTTSVSTPALEAVDGLVNQQGFGYSNFWTMLNGRKGSYVPVDPKYAFGGGDPTILRWGQEFPTSVLNIFNAQTSVEFQALSEIYDTLLISSPVESGKIFCWMCDSFTVSIDSSGNEHVDVQLKQSLRWHDGTPIDSKDVKFSMLNERDHSNAFSGVLLGSLLDVTILSSSELDIVMKGQTVDNLEFISSSFMVPRHLWELSGDKSYGDVGKVDPAKLDYGYDPLAYGTLIGSGPFICRSVFQSDLNRPGTGCATASDGVTRSGQSIPVGGTLLLQVFDFTSEPGNADPFYQYMRSYNTNWGTGSGTSAQSGQFQEWNYAQQDKSGTVTTLDLANVAGCYGATAAGSSTCTVAGYNYWDRSAFESRPGMISGEVAIVASHFDNTWTFPYTWSSLRNIAPLPP